MSAAALFSMSIGGIAYFGIQYWRSVIASVASQTVSESILAVVLAENRPLGTKDFARFGNLLDLTPDLNPGGGGLGLVRFYYGVIQGMDLLVGAHVPVLGAWIQREGAICARFCCAS
jgi:hypothetical protein